MKITIETDSSYEAKITIDGREIVYGLRKGAWRFVSGLPPAEVESTIGGIVADKIRNILPDILQGYMPEDEFNPQTGDLWNTWDLLPEAVAEQVYSRVDP